MPLFKIRLRIKGIDNCGGDPEVKYENLGRVKKLFKIIN